MTKDPIITELRKFRDNYARKHRYSISAICEDLRQYQATHTPRVSKLPAKPIRKTASG